MTWTGSRYFTLGVAVTNTCQRMSGVIAFFLAPWAAFCPAKPGLFIAGSFPSSYKWIAKGSGNNVYDATGLLKISFNL